MYPHFSLYKACTWLCHLYCTYSDVWTQKMLGMHVDTAGCQEYTKRPGCPAYGKRCFKSRKIDNFAVDCKTNGYRKSDLYSPYGSEHNTKIMRDRIKTAVHSDNTDSSDDEVLLGSVGHLSVRCVKKSEEIVDLQVTRKTTKSRDVLYKTKSREVLYNQCKPNPRENFLFILPMVWSSSFETETELAIFRFKNKIEAHILVIHALFFGFLFR